MRFTITRILARAFAQRPVEGHALAHLRDQFGRDHAELFVPHCLYGRLIGGERIIKGDLVISEAKILPVFCFRCRFPLRA